MAILTGGWRGPVPPTAAQVVYSVVLVYAVNVAGTHLVHLAATRLGWRRLPLPSLLWRLAALLPVAAVVVQVASYPVAYVAEPVLDPDAEVPMPPPTVGDVVEGLPLTVAIWAVWAVLYALGVMAFRLADAERERLELRASLAEARSRALEYQLNPHFLFNALNTVRALVLDEPEEARRAVTLLAALLRQTLAAGREATHPLGHELDLVRTYLDLERLRFDGRLRVRLDVADDARSAAVPALLVQTLVENAVKHGVARRREGGEVAVEAALADGRLALRVENPSPDPAAAPLADGTGIGLANARERLALLFGDAARLDLAVGPERAVAEVSFPATVPAPSDV